MSTLDLPHVHLPVKTTIRMRKTNVCMTFRSNRQQSTDQVSAHASSRMVYMYLVPVITITVSGFVYKNSRNSMWSVLLERGTGSNVSL